MNGKSFFVDLTKCTACRGCQVACKQWKKLPAEETVNTGTHQNPPDLSYNTIRLVRFKEEVVDKKIRWNFFPEQCRHCVDPPCVGYSEVEGSMIHDPDTGAVVYTELTKQENYEDILSSCPYNIPRVDPETGVISKCDMCIDRLRIGLRPACVTSCPTGTMNFGDREEMMDLAEKALATVQKKFPEAELVDPYETRVIYLTAYPAQEYYEYLMADAAQTPRKGLTRKQLFAKLGGAAARMRS
ncbi:4Fe-4S dicluster domain-containing protein [Salidesulfovibrio brasiliensis]|uniref:4Fe-4S dicluster domain-containing protein n=1 Tax=Salidesulfovibrio brasiliensis TaxID=221711 RepID=UPI0006D10694|nr:4Fe-4S dicluster domain-containing protein [Salidesulfovibrio brasiliensis]